MVITDHARDVLPDRAKHDNARPYVEHLDEAMANAKYFGPSQATFAASDRRWELYTALPDGKYVLTIVGTSLANPDGEIVTVYVVGGVTMQNRLKINDRGTGEPYLHERKK
ncbi:MAG: hypothetical protein WBA46_17035 [Thermomicrobiales bacterium]